MTGISKKQVEFLVVDTTAFIQNASLHEFSDNIITCKEVVEEITNRRQLRRLVVLPYDLIIKDVFPENIRIITEFSKKTGDYPTLSATDVKVMALTYQLEKEKNGVEHLRTEPVLQKPIIDTNTSPHAGNLDIAGFYMSSKSQKNESLTTSREDIVTNNDHTNSENANVVNYNTEVNQLIDKKDQEPYVELNDNLNNLNFNEMESEHNNILIPVKPNDEADSNSEDDSSSDDSENAGWISISNVKQAKKQADPQTMEEKHVEVACMTTDFAMQNVLRQMNLNVSALDGRIIKHLKTYILRCYTCFKITSIMTAKFCPKCGNNTLKKVAVSVDSKGEMHIHINTKRPLTARGKRFSIPKIKGGKHPNNPILVADQPMPDNKPTRLARTKCNPLDDDYIAGFSPFVTRDINSKSAQLGIRPQADFEQWMKKNPNESGRRRRK